MTIHELSEEPVYDRGNYESVRRIIEEDLIKFDKYMSIKTIIEAHGIGKGQHQYRSMLKNRLNQTLGNKILFVTRRTTLNKLLLV